MLRITPVCAQALMAAAPYMHGKCDEGNRGSEAGAGDINLGTFLTPLSIGRRADTRTGTLDITDVFSRLGDALDLRRIEGNRFCIIPEMAVNAIYESELRLAVTVKDERKYLGVLGMIDRFLLVGVPDSGLPIERVFAGTLEGLLGLEPRHAAEATIITSVL